ncbi:MAG TPA: ATP-dependent Clp protease proteolytic subunit [Pirellulales bacterium]
MRTAMEIAVVGDLTEHEAEITSKLLELPPGAPCTLYFDSPGGSPYSGMAIMSLIRLRGLSATGIVIGECSSAALWPFAACQRRLVTSHSVLLFHPMKWQSEEHVGLAEAAEWARHFAQLETEMDQLLAELLDVPHADISGWMAPGRYVSGRELVAAGLAELVPLKTLPMFLRNGARKRVPVR